MRYEEHGYHYHHPHLKDKKTESERLTNLPKVVKPITGRTGIRPHQYQPLAVIRVRKFRSITNC